MSHSAYFTPSAWKDYLYWHQQDRKTLNRLNRLITECMRNPFGGTGKPERLSGDLAGFWSRRIDGQHRLVYAVEDRAIKIVQCRDHYGDT